MYFREITVHCTPLVRVSWNSQARGVQCPDHPRTVLGWAHAHWLNTELRMEASFNFVLRRGHTQWSSQSFTFKLHFSSIIANTLRKGSLLWVTDDIWGVAEAAWGCYGPWQCKLICQVSHANFTAWFHNWTSVLKVEGWHLNLVRGLPCCSLPPATLEDVPQEMLTFADETLHEYVQTIMILALS